MTNLKIQGSPGAAAQSALEPHIARIYAKPGVRVLGVLELQHVERSQAAPEYHFQQFHRAEETA